MKHETLNKSQLSNTIPNQNPEPVIQNNEPGPRGAGPVACGYTGFGYTMAEENYQ